MQIQVHVREKVFTVHCGDGGQQIRWLATVGIGRYDPAHAGKELGVPRGLRLENGQALNPYDVICSRLQDRENVWVILKEDLVEATD